MLKEKITDDLKNALKSGDSVKAGTLRMILASFSNKEIEKRGKEKESVLTEEEEMEVLIKEAKKRKEAADVYLKGKRGDLMQKELDEAKIIQRYLPEQLVEEEIEKIAQAAIERIKPASEKDFGKVMAEVMKETKGRADSKVVAEIIKIKIARRK